MNVSLPYEIGTILKTVESDKVQYDKVHHYIVGEKIQVVLELCYDTSPRLSVPIDKIGRASCRERVYVLV